MFKKMPFILLGSILAVLFLNPLMPLPLKEGLYALSLSIKALIIFLLPLIIFGLLFKTATQMARKALLILFLVCCSNFLSTMISYFMGHVLYHFDLSLALPADHSGLVPAWSFTLPRLIANNHAMFAGLMLGLGLSFWKKAAPLTALIEQGVNTLLKGFLYIIPLFVIGFIVKLQHDQVIVRLIEDYALIFLFIALAQFSYIILLYVISSGRHILSSLKNMLPAALTGFSTMSSAAAMPLTIVAAEKNAGPAARAIIPATVNIHLIGDCFAIPILAFAVLKNFGLAEPTLTSYLPFAFYFMLAKFSVAAIPGGGIIVMLPILESYLGFNSSMMSLITALYILLDPVITSANVLGNGAFAQLLSWRRPKKEALA